MKVCRTPDCPALIKADAYKGRCPQCNRDAGRARGTTTEQGYGWAHQQQRAAIQQRINDGADIHCWRCDATLEGYAWHLDHNEDRSGYRGPACIPCNLTLAGLAAHE